MSIRSENMNKLNKRPDLSEDSVRSYLKCNPALLEKIVMEEVELDLLERWMIRKTQRDKKPLDCSGGTARVNIRKTSLSRWKFCVHADKRAMLQELTASLHTKPSEFRVLEELARCISSAVNADGYKLYTSSTSSLKLHEDINNRRLNGETEERTMKKVAEVVAQTRQPLRVTRGEPHPLTSDLEPLPETGEARYMLFHPVSKTDGELAGVIQLWRRTGESPFHEEDEEIVSSYLVWGGVALHYAQLYISITTQRQLHEFLLQVVKSIFQDMVSMDALVVKIINFAQHLVQADRASLFLLDSKTNELYARIFDVGQSNGSDQKAPQARDFRFPVGTGIAGYVALTGEILNIPDAYADVRFNRSVDQITGYKTKSILCMPIFISADNILGVVQMVNKKVGTFNKEDEKAFEMFAVYCGLALHHAKLFDKIKRSEQKYKVALEVLSYHSTCTEEEVKQVLPLPSSIPNIDKFHLSVFSMDDMEKVRHAIFMFKDLFGTSKLDADSVVRFTLTVKKNYRRVPYHNWTHGFGVANSMYAVLKNASEIFKPSERLALYIGALCHDLDHRGKNNKFMMESSAPLANMYSTSTMEHHHFNQTVAILQQDGHNILKKLDGREYRQVLGIIKHCILATDLALFFPYQAKLTAIMDKSEFSWKNAHHRELVQAMAMTGSDLSASAKPWEQQIQTVKVIFQEFYQQGDEERAAGRKPIPMMDRYQPEQQALSQVEFLTKICIPCYSLLTRLVPGAEPLLRQCQQNLARWKQIHDDGGVEDVLGLAKK